MSENMDEYYKPRMYNLRVIPHQTLFTLPRGDDMGTWIAFLGEDPTEAQEGESEAEAVWKLLLSCWEKGSDRKVDE